MSAARNPLNVCPYWVEDVLVTMSKIPPQQRWPGTTWVQIIDCMVNAADASGGQYRRRVGSCADGGATCGTQTYRAESCRQWWLRNCCKPKRIRTLHRRPDDRTNFMARRARSHLYNYNWFWPAHAHRQQVHSLLYMAAYRLMLSKGVAV